MAFYASDCCGEFRFKYRNNPINKCPLLGWKYQMTLLCKCLYTTVFTYLVFLLDWMWSPFLPRCLPLTNKISCYINVTSILTKMQHGIWDQDTHCPDLRWYSYTSLSFSCQSLSLCCMPSHLSWPSWDEGTCQQMFSGWQFAGFCLHKCRV